MATIIAVKRIGKAKPGDEVHLPRAQAHVLVLIGHAYYPPSNKVAAAATRAKRQYQRRDMTAEPAAVPEPAPKPAEPAAKQDRYYWTHREDV